MLHFTIKGLFVLPAQRPLRLLDYAGDYDHPGYGGITITLAEGNLHWAYRGMSRPLGIGTTIRWSCPRQPAACLPAA